MALDAVPARGGFVVVHDCNPAHISQIGPMPRYGEEWCGETWRAFIDLGSSLPEAWRWCVVDTDLGVGVIEVPPTLDTVERAAVVVIPTVPNFSNRDDAWSWLEAHRRSVMRLVAHGSWLDEVRGYG